ncbi:SDR family oxidoreductase [Methylobacterium sp. SD274]|uniref:SDR family oxidoreductase n=1 Tax=Methylobacterium sp. SD274 TaxID=2782009 RepID=UPI001A97CF71|nr:SDR family oxidoreductase [Methylobacterium sp. SD274]MBO1020446.1 SDR family oxidoreductase [Methylobacterium sp. SD274]
MSDTLHPTLFVTGASGHLGRLVIAALLERVPAGAVVAGVRSLESEAAQALRDRGVAVRVADYARPETLAEAFRGIERLLLISSSEVGRRVAQHGNVIAAAKAAGIGRLVYISLLHADTSPLSLAGEHRATEAAIAGSNLPATILRNGWYTENYTASIPGALAGGAFLGSAGDGRIASAARADFAAAAALVLAGDGHDGRTYELAGDEAYTLADLAAELSRQTGRDIPYRDLPQADYAALLKGFGLPDVLADSLAAWDVDAAHGALFDEGRQLSTLIGRPTTPLSASIAAALG